MAEKAIWDGESGPAQTQITSKWKALKRNHLDSLNAHEHVIRQVSEQASKDHELMESSKRKPFGFA